MDLRFKFYYSMAIFLVLFFLPFTVNAEPLRNNQTLIKTLQAGGYNLYFRHERTDWSQHDNVQQKGEWLSCDGSRIRQLSQVGRQRAQRTGVSLKKNRIPVSEVLASPYCRTMETARLFDVGQVQPTDAVINLRVADHFGGSESVIETAQKLLSRIPSAGSNRVIVAHGNIAREATSVYPDEGEMIVFEPDGQGNFSYVGRISPDQWSQLNLSN